MFSILSTLLSVLVTIPLTMGYLMLLVLSLISALFMFIFPFVIAFRANSCKGMSSNGNINVTTRPKSDYKFKLPKLDKPLIHQSSNSWSYEHNEAS